MRPVRGAVPGHQSGPAVHRAGRPGPGRGPRSPAPAAGKHRRLCPGAGPPERPAGLCGPEHHVRPGAAAHLPHRGSERKSLHHLLPQHPGPGSPETVREGPGCHPVQCTAGRARLDHADQHPAQSGGLRGLSDPAVRAEPGPDRRGGCYHGGRLFHQPADQRMGLPPPGRGSRLPKKDRLHRPKDRVHPAGQGHPHLWAAPLAFGRL